MSQPTAPILVTGANGQLGRRLIQRLAAEAPPRRTRALVRSQRAADSLADMAPAACSEVRIVDYRDAAGLSAAAAGCEAAVHMVGILKQTRSNRYEDAHERPAEALAEAARRTGLRRVILLSILGSRPDAANACLASKGRAERILLASPAATTVLRVPMVLGPGDPASNALRRQAQAGSVWLVRGGASREQPIAADDVVRAILAALALPDPRSETLDLAGPESLSHRALVERAARVIGRSGVVGVRPLPAFVARGFAGLAERLLPEPPVTRAMLEVLEQDDDIDPGPACRRLGLTLTPLDEALRRAFAADEAAT